jgi:tetratricopeptide (TPR) repeat protein
MMYSQYQLLINVPFLEYAHHLVLSVGLGFGFVGLISLLWLVISFYRYVFQVERSIDKNQRAPFFRAVWLGATVIFLHGLVDSVQFSEARWTLPGLFVLLALTVVTGRPALANPDSTSPVSIGLPRFAKWGLPVAIAMTLLVIAFVFRQPISAAWYANLGAVHQAKADLSPRLNDTEREEMQERAQTYFVDALQLNPQNETALRRLGMIASADNDFNLAITYLDQAYALEPNNQATLKALGYAYLWSGQFDAALSCFQRVKFRGRLLQELDWWQWQWGERQQTLHAHNARKMALRLAAQ